jgi:hypothetical protein
MTGLRLFVCGPANGSVAFELPGGRRGNDDSVFLPSSIFTPEPGQWVLRVWTIRLGGRKLLRVGLYRQVFESGLDRPGHTFSAVLEFDGNLPPGDLVVQTLWEICELIEAQCTKDGHFCGLEQFHGLFASEIFPSFSGITAQVFANGAADGIGDRASANSYTFIYHPLPDWSIPSLGGVVEWFFRSPASFVCESIIVAKLGTGTPGPEFRQVMSLDALAAVAMDALTRQLVYERSLSAQTSQQHEWHKEQSTQVLNAVRHELARATQMLEQNRRHAQQLERELTWHKQELELLKRVSLPGAKGVRPQVNQALHADSGGNGTADLGKVRLDGTQRKGPSNRAQSPTSNNAFFIVLCVVLVVVVVSLLILVALDYSAPNFLVQFFR